MADTTPTPNGSAGTPTPNPSQPIFRGITQFIRDLSFENPGNRPTHNQPEMALGVDVGANAVEGNENTYEVFLKIRASATTDETPLFLLELEYVGIFHLEGFPEDQMEPLLYIECARMIFPFARRIIAEITRDGGFPPLLLDPVDFLALYREGKAKQKQAAATTPRSSLQI